MKVSLAWIFDHINASYKKVDVPTLVEKFNQTTAEIDNFYKVEIDLDTLALARVTSITTTAVQLYCSEWGKSVELSTYLDGVVEGQLFLIKQEGKEYRWATSVDLGADKKIPLPQLFCLDNHVGGGWKKELEAVDWILTIDNTSITNRPDLWGHRGVAREVAAMLNLPLKSLDGFLAKKDIKEADGRSVQQDDFSLTNKAPQECIRFAGLLFEYVERRASLVWMVSRLSRVDSRSIDALVDMTNYVMLDISQPLHAFDAKKIPSKKIVVCLAKSKEHLLLLDDRRIALTGRDLVVTDGSIPLAIAGIMGGKASAITAETDALFLEAGCFDATTIRKTSVQFGIRTEASSRFEKSLDPNQNVVGILRFLKLVYDADIDVKEAPEILSLGKRVPEQKLTIEHNFIEKRLGTAVSSEFIVKILEKLGFTVEQNKGMYTILVPTFRGTKDIQCKEDIVEEVGRFFGYDNIPYILPQRQMEPFSVHGVMRLRAIKELMAFGLKMREIQQYAFFDQDFLQSINWQPSNGVAVQNPVSANWRQLATTLLPNLFKTVKDHSAEYDSLRFFEWGRIWHKNKKVKEQKTLSAIVFEQKEPISFYTGKTLLEDLFALLQLDVVWTQVDKPSQPWFAPYQSAFIMHQDKKIGIAGKVSRSFFEQITLGDAFVFELDGDYLVSYAPSAIEYTAPSKYPHVERDISMLVPTDITVDQLTTVIGSVDKRIEQVLLLDFFQKKDWTNKKSITMRFVIKDPAKTMTKEEVESIWNDVAKEIKKLGATVR